MLINSFVGNVVKATSISAKETGDRGPVDTPGHRTPAEPPREAMRGVSIGLEIGPQTFGAMSSPRGLTRSEVM
jgi:hypothetical protein